MSFRLGMMNALLGCVMGLTFGMWQKNIYAGMFMAMFVTLWLDLEDIRRPK